MRATHAQVHELAAEVTYLLDEAAADTHGNELDGTVNRPTEPGTTWTYTIYPGKNIELGLTPGDSYEKLRVMRETLNIILGHY